MTKGNVNHLCLSPEGKASSCFKPYNFKDQLEEDFVGLEWRIRSQSSTYSPGAAHRAGRSSRHASARLLSQGGSAAATGQCGDMGRLACTRHGARCCMLAAGSPSCWGPAFKPPRHNGKGKLLFW